MNAQEIATYIDHTNLKATATAQEITTLCQEAEQFGFASVCINPYFVELAATQLAQSQVKVCTVVGFPLGATTPATKVIEAIRAITDGVDEIDMVLNVSALKSQNLNDVRYDIESVRKVTEGHLLKVILETCYLSDSEIITATEIALEAGADFVKTSTGFGTAGATTSAVALMRTHAKTMQIKASGGIRDLKTAVKMIEAGANRLGTSSGPAIVEGLSATENY